MSLATVAVSSPPAIPAPPVVLSGHSSWVNGVAVGVGVVATAGNDGRIGLWRLADGARLAWLQLPRPHPPLGESPLLAHLGVPVYGVAFDPAGHRLAAGCGGCGLLRSGISPVGGWSRHEPTG